MYDKIRKWYKLGLWTEDQVLMAAEKGIVTDEQAADILGK